MCTPEKEVKGEKLKGQGYKIILPATHAPLLPVLVPILILVPPTISGT